jgi:enamine deaminase RidA (YjgF/YER057c/UK114 family)
MERKLIPALELAGSSLGNVVKAQVYLTDKADLDFFAQVWFDYFGDKPPATTIIPCSDNSLAVEAACVEINLVAVADDAGLPIERFGQGSLPGFDHYPAAVKAGDLLFISGLLACGPNGPAARRDLDQPYFTSHPQAQAEHILATAEQLCGMAGTSLKRVVRAHQFQADISEFYAIHQAWRAYASDLHVPFSAIEIGGRLPIQDATLLMDLWVYAPDET